MPTPGADVEITDSQHPHYGARGVLEGSDQSIRVAGKRLYLIDFHRKHQGERGCYAGTDQIEKDSRYPT